MLSRKYVKKGVRQVLYVQRFPFWVSLGFFLEIVYTVIHQRAAYGRMADRVMNPGQPNARVGAIYRRNLRHAWLGQRYFPRSTHP